MKRQDVRYGTEFPNDQNDGSLFIRTDLPGNMMFQYVKKINSYVQIEAIGIIKEHDDGSGGGGGGDGVPESSAIHESSIIPESSIIHESSMIYEWKLEKKWKIDIDKIDVNVNGDRNDSYEDEWIYIGFDSIGPFDVPVSIYYKGYVDNDLIIWSGGWDKGNETMTWSDIENLNTIYYNPSRNVVYNYDDYKSLDVIISENTVFGIRVFNSGSHQGYNPYAVEGSFKFKYTIDLVFYKISSYENCLFKLITKNDETGSQTEEQYEQSELPDSIEMQLGYEYELYIKHK